MTFVRPFHIKSVSQAGKPRIWVNGQKVRGAGSAGGMSVAPVLVKDCAKNVEADDPQRRYRDCFYLGPIAADGGKIPPMVVLGAASRWVAPLRSILVGFGIFSLGSLSDLWLHQHAERLFIAIMADALIGVGVGLLVLLYERRQRQNIIRKLEVIRLMNHHVRNSLQVISFAASSPNQELAREVRAAMERIEWALREVLPGQREDISDLPLHPHANDPKPKIVA